MLYLDTLIRSSNFETKLIVSFNFNQIDLINSFNYFILEIKILLLKQGYNENPNSFNIN